MPACNYHVFCALTDEADPAAGFCILHSPQEDKDPDAFANTMRVHRETKGDQFDCMVFPKTADLRNMTFAGGASFFGATFAGLASFRGATFAGKASFVGTTFAERAVFFGAAFAGEASFVGTTFSGQVDFVNMTFAGVVDFGGATFAGVADFGGTIFAGPATFTNATFSGPATFTNATFSRPATFDKIFFASDATFSRSHFFGRALFSPKQVGERQKLPVFSANATVDFRDLVLESPERLSFRHADFQTCRFLNTDLRKVELTGAVWPQRGRRRIVYDEIAPYAPDEPYPWEELERLYRELKQNYDERRNYPRVGDFHYGEKEMQRRNPGTPRSLKVFLWLYSLVSGYGERFLRPLFWAGVVLVVGTWAYLWWGLQPKSSEMTVAPARIIAPERIITPGITELFLFPDKSTPPTRLAITNISDWLSAMNFSLRAMTLLRPDDLVPVGGAKFVYTLQSLLGPLFLGLFALAVRQRLKH